MQRLLTKAEVAKALGCHPEIGYAHVARGPLRPTRKTPPGTTRSRSL